MSKSLADGRSPAVTMSWLTYAALRLLASPAGRIPLHAGNRWLRCLADFSWHVWPHVRRGLLHNLSHVMQAPANDPAVQDAAHQAYRHLWLNYLDLLRTPALSPSALAAGVTIEGESILHQVWRRQGRAILVTGHFAGGELALQAMAARGWTACVPAEHLQPEAFFRWMCDLRSRHGHRLVPSDSLLRPLVRALRSGGGVVLALDRDSTQSGMPVRLCGAMARLPTGAAMLGQRYGIPLIPVYSQRRANGQVVVTVGEPVSMPANGSMSTRHGHGLEILASTFERMVTAAPEQWVLTAPLWDSSIDV